MSKNYSQESLLEFLDYADRTGMLPKNTAQARKTATQKLLAVLDGGETTDLRELDIDDVAARFANRHKTDYTAQSLRVYQSRAKTAINDFIAWVDNPSGFKPSGKRSTKPAAGRQQTASDAGNNGTEKTPAGIAKTRDSTPTVAYDTFNIPIPIREDIVVEVTGLPKNLRPNEAQKISAIVTAYAIKEDK